MTTKPKAKKFRIRRTSAAASPASHDRNKALDFSATDGEDGFGSKPYPTAAPRPTPADALVPSDTPGARTPAEEMDAIRKEGLTGRQLRMARRIAQKHGLAPTSDYDAVIQLRHQGIDPFRRTNMLELVISDKELEANRKSDAKLPATVRSQLPASELLGEQDRMREIMAIQNDVAQRRRRKSLLLSARLVAFVFLPTVVAGYYYYRVATPMYATKSEFVIQQAQSLGQGQLGSFFSGTAMATSQDSITVQGYLQSRGAMLRLDKDLGFRKEFSNPKIDPLQRLDNPQSLSATYQIYRTHVKVGYDPTEGIIKMEVSTPDPKSSAAYSKALISYAEQRVDRLTKRLREDGMKGASTSYADAEAKMLAAQKRVIALQEKVGVVSASAAVTSLMSQISARQVELASQRLKLQQYQDNPRPNAAKVRAVQNRIAGIQKIINGLKAQLTKGGKNSASLAKISGELLVAQSDLTTRQTLLAAALQQLETARIEANRQVRYLSLGVAPVAPDRPTYPRAFQNTLLALLIFAGIYLMASLTASILREQISA